jgi:hypothetical protein
MKIRARWLAALSIAVALTSGNASANFTCAGKVTYLGLGVSGTVTIDIGFGTWYLCDLTDPFTNNGITFSPEGCRGMYGGILAAQKADQPVRFFFSSSANTNNGPECSMGSWVNPNPAPYHMSLVY